MNPSITGIWGAPGTIKSTLAASWPMGISWHEFDIGGFERGSAYLNEEQKAGIIFHQYPAPLRLLLEKDGHLLAGWFELYQGLLANLEKDCANPAIQTVVIDTGTLCWQACHRAYLQMLQKKNSTRESLQQMEYGDVNPWMYNTVQYPKLKGKHLVLTFHDEPIYVPNPNSTGKFDATMEHPKGYRKHRGWTHFPSNADLLLHTVIKKRIPYAIFEDHGDLSKEDVKTGIAPLELTRMEVANPTFEKIVQLVEGAKTIKARNLPMPETPESIIEQGQALGAR